MAIEGTPRFNAIQLMEISSIQFTKGSPAQFRARGAFVDTVSGNTYGQTSCIRFSVATLQALQLFQEAIEQDLADLVFESTVSHDAQQPTEPSGIGEALSRELRGEDGVESV